VSLTAKSLDGSAHAVQVYSDISAGAWYRYRIPVPFVTGFVAEWLSADRTQPIVWSTTANNDVVYLKAQLQNPAVFNEIAAQPEWGTVYHGMKSVSGNAVTRRAIFHS
jgi:hypothetical protein